MLIQNELNKIRKFSIKYDGIMPKRSTPYSAGYDLFTPVDVELQPKEEIIIDTYVWFETTEYNDVVFIYPRSGQGFNYYIRLANTTGVIDADYNGTIKVKLRNEGDRMFSCKKGTAIAQAVIQQFLITIDDEPIKRYRGENGFGSSDI